MPAVASVVDCGMLSTSLGGRRRLRTHGRLPFAQPRFVASREWRPERSCRDQRNRLRANLTEVEVTKKNLLTGRKSSTSHASIATSASVVGASRLDAFSKAILNKAPCRFATAFPNQSPQARYPWIGTSVESRHQIRCPGPRSKLP